VGIRHKALLFTMVMFVATGEKIHLGIFVPRDAINRIERRLRAGTNFSSLYMLAARSSNTLVNLLFKPYMIGIDLGSPTEYAWANADKMPMFSVLSNGGVMVVTSPNVIKLP